LRVLEERVVVRLGSTRGRSIDVRIIASTNRDLEGEVALGRFRQDLYFRLNGLSLTIPPLRERRVEIPALAYRFLRIGCELIGRDDVPTLSPDALELLSGYAWPGNVRELRNAMERAAVLCAAEIVLPEHLPGAMRQRASLTPAVRPLAAGQQHPTPTGSPGVGLCGLPAEIRRLERERIVDALREAGGVQSEAARALGISRRTLISRIEQFGLPRPRKPSGASGAESK
jgi:DNA-binding NtrC family response regulator